MRRHRLALAATLLFSPFAAIQAADTNLVVGLTTKDKLVTFDRAAPGTVSRTVNIRNLHPGESVLGIDFRPADGKLYALTSAGRILTVVPRNGVTEQVSTLFNDPSNTTAFTGLSGVSFGVDFNPVPDRLRVVSDAGQNLRINVATGAVLVDGALNPGAPSVTAAAYTNAFAGTTTTTLYTIDTHTDTLQVQNPPNSGTQTSPLPLGVDASAIDGFDIRGTDGLGLASLTVGGVTGLYTINLATGAATLVGAVGDGSRSLKGLATPTPSVDVFAVTDAATLVRFDPAKPGKFRRLGAITGLDGSGGLVGLDFRPATGQLVGLTTTGGLFAIDPATAVATALPALTADVVNDATPDYAGLVGNTFGVDFNPAVDRLRVVSDTGQNLRVNVGTGGTITDAAINAATAKPSSAAYTNSLPGATTTALYVIDSSNARLYQQNPPNNGTLVEVGALGVAPGFVPGFDIVGSGNVALASLFGANGSCALYTINLTTGAATKVGDFPMAVQDIAHPIAAAPEANSTMFALASNTLYAFGRSAPGTFSPGVAITGLQASENLTDIDFRPANGLLYGVSNQGRIYQVDTATGAATLSSTLAADAADTTAPFTGFVGTDFGFDFNPVPDRLRGVSDAGQNLRINVDTGATTTDGDINRPAPVLTAAAYTNNFPTAAPGGAGGGTTTLYVLEAGENLLSIQSPPNNGTIAPVGKLGVDVPATGATFDIAGGHNGLALAAFDADNDGRPELYRVNLATGAATLVGPLGSASNGNVTSLAIRLR